MKPRTKLQVRVKALSDALPALTDAQEQYAFKHCLKHVAYRTKKQTACLDCGHVWASEDNTTLLAKLVDTQVVCPACGVKLTIEDTRKKKLYQRQVHISLLDVREEFQVVRIFQVWGHYRVGEVPSRHIWEVIQQFFVPDGKIQIVAKIIAQGCYDSFCGDMEVRNPSNGWYGFKYDVWAKMMFPKPKVLPIYNRNGFVCKVDDVSAWELCKKLTFDSKTETLLKAKQLSLLTCRVSRNESHRIQKHWDSIKICMRNKYVVKPGEDITYLDYLDLLEYFKKDLRSVKYCCPKDLKKVHDQLVAKKQAIVKHARAWNDYKDLIAYFHDKADQSLYKKPVPLQLEINRLSAHRAERELRKKKKKASEKISKDQLDYMLSHGRYFGLAFAAGNLTVSVMETVEDFFIKGELFKHCIFSNEYYKNAESLCLCAYVDGTAVETIQLSLSDFRLLQSRGIGNQATEHHKRIEDLVKNNIQLIKKAAKQPKNNQVAA